MNDSKSTGGVESTPGNPVPALPSHNAAHTILSELEDALLVEGLVITAELANWAKGKLLEAKSHL